MRYTNRVRIVAAVLLGASGAAAAQAPTPGLTVESPCPLAVPDAAADARRDAIGELMLTPTPPQEFFKAFAAAQSAAPPPDQARLREQLARDWPGLCRYKEANAALAGEPPPRVVFMGDSITEGWVSGDAALFAVGVVGRGISAQTSPQMLVRFRQDVVALKPRVVHIMAGTNDIAGNTGPTTVRDFQNNILAMLDIARANGIAVVLAGIPPSKRLYWRELDRRRESADQCRAAGHRRPWGALVRRRRRGARRRRRGAAFEADHTAAPTRGRRATTSLMLLAQRAMSPRPNAALQPAGGESLIARGAGGHGKHKGRPAGTGRSTGGRKRHGRHCIVAHHHRNFHRAAATEALDHLCKQLGRYLAVAAEHRRAPTRWQWPPFPAARSRGGRTL